MLPKAHLTLHSRMSGSTWVITPSWLSCCLEENRYIYGWAPSLFTWNYHNIVNQLYPNIKLIFSVKNKENKNKNHTFCYVKSKNIWCSKQIFWTCSIQNMIRCLRALLTPVTGTLLHGVRDGVWDSIGSVQYSKKSWLQMCLQIYRIVKVFWHILVLSTPIFSSCGKRFSGKTK